MIMLVLIAAVARAEEPGGYQTPPIWRVTMGEHVLWVVGTIRPLPAGFTKEPWSGPRLAQVAADATTYVGPPMIETRISNPLAALNALRHYNALRRIPRRETLADVLPAPMYDRFEQPRQQLGVRSRSVTRLRPMLAANELLEVALKKNGLTDRDFSKSVRRLATRNGASAVKPQIKVSIGEAVVLIRSLPESIELRMQATLDYLESGIQNAELTASLWRAGRLSDLYRYDYSLVDRCADAAFSGDAADGVRERAWQLWRQAVLDALQHHAVSIASLPLHELTKADSPLCTLPAELAVHHDAANFWNPQEEYCINKQYEATPPPPSSTNPTPHEADRARQ